MKYTRLSTRLVGMGRLGTEPVSASPASSETDTPAESNRFSGAAGKYLHLGSVFLNAKQFDQAEQCYRAAATLSKRFGLHRSLAEACHQLGCIAQGRWQLDEARIWFVRALAVYEHLGLEHNAAITIHNLGLIDLYQSNYDGAEEWFLKALEAEKRLGLHRDVAHDYHRLGAVAQERGRFDEAEAYYRRALELFEGMDCPPLSLYTLSQLGFLFHERGRLDEALCWFGQAWIISRAYKVPRACDNVLVGLARLLLDLGEDVFTSSWQRLVEERDAPLEAISNFLKRIQ